MGSPGAGYPGWQWLCVVFAFPLGGVLGRAVGGPVDAVGAALAGGLITGACLATVQWLVARELFGDPRLWIGASAVAYALGLAAGAALAGYETDAGSLALMGAVSGAFLGLAQGLALIRAGQARLALAWGAAMPVLLALGWLASSAIGVDVERQYTVFGAMGAIVFTLLTGLLLTRSRPPAPAP